MSTPLAAPLASQPSSTVWRRALLPLLLLLIAIIAAYYGTFRGMVMIWERSGTFAHAFVVPPIALWLIWRKRDEMAAYVPRPSPWLLLPFAGLCLTWLMGNLVAINAVTQLAATALLVLAVPLVLGWRVAMVVLFPLIYFFYAVPIGEFMMPALMRTTADFTVTALRLTGIPVYREGQQFVIPSGSWSVVEACSGVRYLMASFMVGSLFAYLNYSSWKRRAAFVLVSLIVPIVANWLRAYMIVMLGHLSGNRLAVGVDHLIYGWVFFGVVITAVFMIGARWAEAPRDPVAPSRIVDAQADKPGISWAVVIVAIVLVALPTLAQQRIEAGESAAKPRLDLSAPLSPDWQPATGSSSPWKPSFENPSADAVASYVDRTGHTVGLYLAYYRQQDEQRKLVSSNNVMVGTEDKVWNAVSDGTRSIDLAGRTIQVHETQLVRTLAAGGADRQAMLTWRFYWVNGSLTQQDHWAKLLGAWYRLTGRGDESAAVVIYATEQPDIPATKALENFLRANLGMIEARLQATRDAR